MTESETTRPQTGRVLIVDDEPETLFLCKKFIEHGGHEVACAQSGEEALRVAGEFKPQAIVLDCMMPGMDGFTLARRLREIPEFSSTPIIMLTALSEMKDKIAGFQAGINDYLTKPFNPEELLLRIKSFLANSEREQLSMERSRFEILRQTATAVAHHINNPLQTILTATDMLKDDMHAENRGQIVDMIREKALTIAKLIGKLNRTNKIISTAYVGTEKMLDIEASASNLEQDEDLP